MWRLKQGRSKKNLMPEVTLMCPKMYCEKPEVIGIENKISFHRWQPFHDEVHCRLCSQAKKYRNIQSIVRKVLNRRIDDRNRFSGRKCGSYYACRTKLPIIWKICLEHKEEYILPQNQCRKWAQRTEKLPCTEFEWNRTDIVHAKCPWTLSWPSGHKWPRVLHTGHSPLSYCIGSFLAPFGRPHCVCLIITVLWLC